MKNEKRDTGYFVFSLDTELAWGGLWDQPYPKQTARNGATEREVIQHLLDMMDEFRVVATWAITGHLFYEKCEECEICPIMSLKGKDSRFEQIWGTQESMWYGADIVDTLLSRNSGHEIGFHGYTHRVFGKLSKDEARFEIQEWLRLAKRKGVAHLSVVFPQGSIGHLDLFQEAGFICYRGKDLKHPMFSIPLLGKVLNVINLRVPMLTPQVYEIKVNPQGLVNIPSSQWLFRANRKIEIILDSLKLPTLRFWGTAKSIKKAAEENKVVHLWVHPHEFRTEKDFEKLRFVFERYAEQASVGKLQSITMANLAQKAKKEFNASSTLF